MNQRIDGQKITPARALKRRRMLDRLRQRKCRAKAKAAGLPSIEKLDRAISKAYRMVVADMHGKLLHAPQDSPLRAIAEETLRNMSASGMLPENKGARERVRQRLTP